MTAVLVLAAHGTRSASGLATTYAVADAVRAARPQLDVRVSFVDVAQPVFADVVADVAGPLVVVPVLLSGGYHVHVDIPRALRERRDAVLAPALGPDRALSQALADRLRAARAGRAPAGRVLLVATGSSDASARADVVAAAADLGHVLDESVEPVFMNGPGADLDTAVAAGGDVVSYLLAEGFFYSRLQRLAARQIVSAPIGVHPALIELICRRYDAARAGWRPAAPARPVDSARLSGSIGDDRSGDPPDRAR